MDIDVLISESDDKANLTNLDPVVLIDGSSDVVNKWGKMIALKASTHIECSYFWKSARVFHRGDAVSRQKLNTMIKKIESHLNGEILVRKGFE